ncbi:hypothetical protein AO269_16890 [Pseudomonas putida]|nr:hypothetical protein AO269_16890 [Pseudomonas putida]
MEYGGCDIDLEDVGEHGVGFGSERHMGCCLIQVGQGVAQAIHAVGMGVHQLSMTTRVLLAHL